MPQTPEEKREYQRKYREAHGEKNRERARRWYQDHRAEKNAANRKSYHAHIEQQKARAHKYYEAHLSVRKYGITKAAYDQLLEQQNGVCAVCNENRGNKRLNVDHDHATDTIRGLLCHKCNLALGHMEDNPEWLRELADYVERTR